VSAAPEAASLTERAYECIRQDVIFGRLDPGARLRLEDLRARYDLGGTPLREALSRLSAEGLIEATAQRGFRVADISVADLDDVASMRIRLECDALRESIAFGEDAWEAGVAGAHHTLAMTERRGLPLDEAGFAQWEARNRAFHEALVAASRSRWTQRFRALVYDQHERYRRVSVLHVPHRVEDGAAEHAALKDAALARDAERACALTEAHIMRTVGVIRAALEGRNA